MDSRPRVCWSRGPQLRMRGLCCRDGGRGRVILASQAWMVWVARCSWASSHICPSPTNDQSRASPEARRHRRCVRDPAPGGPRRALANAGRVEVMGCVEEGCDQRVGRSCLGSDRKGGPPRREVVRRMTLSRVRSPDGTEIAYWTSGDGPPLVLVHGTPADHTRWRPLLPYLEPHFTVHVMDLRGRGDSGDGPEYDIAREYEDVAAVVDAVAEATGSKVNVYGHSHGGILAFGAATQTASISKLVLYEGWPVPDPSVYALPPGLQERMDALLAAGDRDGWSRRCSEVSRTCPTTTWRRSRRHPPGPAGSPPRTRSPARCAESRQPA